MMAPLSHSSIPSPCFPEAAYVWQRVWTEPVAAAVRRSTGFISAWHVLAAEINQDGVLASSRPDWAMLAKTGAPIVAVVRIDGRLDVARQSRVADLVSAIAEAESGIAGIEIDYDCPTAALPDYAMLLRGVRDRLPARYSLAITSLPIWLGSAAFPTVLASVDWAVLQVHAVDNPHQGLFDRTRALDWAEAMGRITTKPFLVALPDYQVRVGWDGDGRLSSVTGEVPGFEAADGRELAANPRDVAALIQDLADTPPPHLAGLVWFRMPTDADTRSWRFNTWQAVIEGVPLRERLSVGTVPADMPGTRDVIVANEGTIDAMLPRRVTLPDHCRFADGVGGYALDAEAGALTMPTDRLIHAGETRRIGWERCEQRVENVH